MRPLEWPLPRRRRRFAAAAPGVLPLAAPKPEVPGTTAGLCRTGVLDAPAALLNNAAEDGRKAMSSVELLLEPGATGAGIKDVPGFGPIIGILCTVPPILVGIDAFSAPGSDREESIWGELFPTPPSSRARSS